MTNPNTHTTTRVRTQYAYKMCLTIFDNAMMYCPLLIKKKQRLFLDEIPEKWRACARK